MQKITNDLLALAQNGDETAVAALIARMMPAIRKGAAAATAPGLDFEDAVQEGLIGLFEAMHRYDTAAGMAFASFAAACITHAQQDARRAALRKKHAPLNFSVPLPDAKELPQPGPDPEEQAIASEQSPERTAVIDGLNQSMMEATGYTCEELGIDANAYADWALSNFSYQIDSCYAHTDEGTASLYLYTWGPDLLDMRATLRQSVYSYMSELDTGEAGAKRPLTENEQAHIRGLLAEAIENAEMDSESFLGFQLAFEDGTWVLDLEQAQYQLGIPLGY